MNFAYRIFPEKRCIVQCFWGDVSLRDVIECSKSMWADAAYDPAFDGISDLRGCTTRAVPSDVPALIAFLRNPQASSGRWATIFTDPRGTALTMLFKNAIFPKLWIEIYSSWEGACKALNLNLPDALNDPKLDEE